MIGVRFDPLVERWLVSLLGHDVDTPDLPLAFKATEADALSFARSYLNPGEELRRMNVDLTRYEMGRAPAELERSPLDAKQKTIAAIVEACNMLEHPELVQIARTCARIVSKLEEVPR